jgi:signal transduction histidine kinase
LSARLAPNVLLSAAVAISLTLAVIAVGLAMGQRWLGLGMAGWAEGDFIWIETVDPEGPSADVAPSSVLATITGHDGAPVALTAQDLIEEPDTLPTYAAMQDFFDRQDLIARMLDAGPVTLTTEHLSEQRLDQTRAVAQRPAGDLPAAFWMQIAVGLAGFWIGVWIWTLRRTDRAAQCLGFAGGGLMVSAFAAAIYSTRELALPGDLFRVLSQLNLLGALAFGVGIIGLFLVYPRRLLADHWIAAPAFVFAIWFVLDVLRVWDGPETGRHLPVLLAMLTIFVLIGLQFRATRGNPRDRAALTWLGLAVIVGVGAFVATVIAPVVLGLGPILSQGQAFLFFLLFYAGIALGVARFQLFRLDEWAFRILFYVLGVVALLVIDAVLILTIVDERAPAFALSLIIVASVWLPLRDALAHRALRRRMPPRTNLFRQVLDVALAPPGRPQEERWRALLDETFSPLSITSVDFAPAASLLGDGLALAVPGPGGLPHLLLEYAAGGRRLFSRGDADLAAELSAMLANALESRAAYEKGASEERRRIARDIHDNIGVQLMGALHSQGIARKDMMIRETLTDLRDIINNAAQPELSFTEMLADLRAQIAETLHAADVRLRWEVPETGPAVLPLTVTHALRSVIREAVQNALRHASPTVIGVTVGTTDAAMTLSVTDDGGGFDTAADRTGNGLANMHARVTGLGGQIEISGSKGGTRIDVRVPLAQ